MSGYAGIRYVTESSHPGATIMTDCLLPPKADVAMLLQDFVVDIEGHPDYISAVVSEALLGKTCRSGFGGIL